MRKSITPWMTLSLLLMLAGAVARATPVYAVGSSNKGRDAHDSLYVVNPVTGTMVRIGPIADGYRDMGMESLAFSPSLGLFGVQDGVLYSINTGTGQAADVGTLGVNLTALVYGPNGIMYGATGNKLYTVDTSNGHASLVGSSTGAGGEPRNGDSSEALEFDSSGHLYATGGGQDPNSLYLINPATGASTRIGKPGAIGFDEVEGLAFVGGTMYGFTTTGLEITIDLSNGVGTLLKDMHLGFEATAVDPPGETSEPAYLVLVGLALTAIFHGRRAVRWGGICLQTLSRRGRWRPNLVRSYRSVPV